MRRSHLLFGLLAILSLTVCRVSISQVPSATQLNPFDKPVEEIQRDIARWDLDANIQIAFAATIGILGILISASQKSRQAWCKTAAIVMGIATSIVTVVSALIFPADYRSYRTASTEGRAVVKSLEAMIAFFSLAPNPTREDVVTFKNGFDNKVEEFNKLSRQLVAGSSQSVSSSGPAGAASAGSLFIEMQLLRRVYAQTSFEPPAWVKNVPSDNLNVYFLGTGVDTSLSKAKTDSLNDAVAKASAALTPSEIYSDNTFVRNAAVVQDTFFTFDKQSAKYTYYTLLRISRGILHIAPWVYEQKHWHPVALAYDPNSGLFVFDDDGAVSQVSVDQAGIHTQKLFRLNGSDRPADLTADRESIFAASNNNQGCKIYQYSRANKKVSQRLIALTGSQRGCDGIAADNGALYIVLAGRKEIRYWPNWGTAASDDWGFTEINPLGGVLALDKAGSRLIYADQLGAVFGIALPTKKIQALASDVGAVHAIAQSPTQFLLASGKKVLFYSRTGFQGENAPASMKSLPGGILSGVAVDSSKSAWVADFDKGIIEGPFPLN